MRRERFLFGMKPTQPPAANVDHIEIGAFLSAGRGPEHEELLRLIGSLLDHEVAHV